MVVVVVVEGGCVGSTSLTPILVTTVAKEAHARRELDLVVVSALLVCPARRLHSLGWRAWSLRTWMRVNVVHCAGNEVLCLIVLTFTPRRGASVCTS